MASTTDLIHRLKNIDLASTATNNTTTASTPSVRHYLAFDFPAFALLPVGARPRIERPANIQSRRRPELANSVDSHGTEFYSLLDVSPRSRGLAQSHYDNCLKLKDCIDSLCTHAGRSSLRLMSFSVNDDISSRPEVHHRFLLETKFSKAGDYKTQQEIVLNEREWQLLKSHSKGEQWIEVLMNLSTRASDRAYLEVQSRIREKYGDYAVDAEEAPWAEFWYEDPQQTVRQAFIAQFQPCDPAEEGIFEADGDALVDVRLPCSHEMSIRKILIDALTLEGYLTARCPTCQQRILPSAYREPLDLRKDREDADTFYAMDATWEGLDHIVAKSRGLQSFDTEDLVQALSVSLESLRESPLVCPPSLCLAKSSAADSTMELFDNVYGGAMLTMSMTSLDLYESLHNLARNTGPKSGVDPVVASKVFAIDWKHFLCRWLARSVNFLTDRRCPSRDGGHVWFHMHSDGMYYYCEAEKTVEKSMEDMAMED